MSHMCRSMSRQIVKNNQMNWSLMWKMQGIFALMDFKNLSDKCPSLEFHSWDSATRENIQIGSNTRTRQTQRPGRMNETNNDRFKFHTFNFHDKWTWSS